jgi:hypothetical protein
VKQKDTSKSISLKEKHNFENKLPQVTEEAATQQLHFVSKLNGNKQVLLDTRMSESRQFDSKATEIFQQ